MIDLRFLRLGQKAPSSKRVKNLLTYPFRKEFEAAQREHLQLHEKLGLFEDRQVQNGLILERQKLTWSTLRTPMALSLEMQQMDTLTLLSYVNLTRQFSSWFQEAKQD
jgi:hypothetical protein